MSTAVKVLLGVVVLLSACGGNGGDTGTGAPDSDSASDDGLMAACEYIVANQDGVDPTQEEVEEVKRLADDPEFERAYEGLIELQSESPDGPSLANFEAFVEQASKVRASCANAGVVIPEGETSEDGESEESEQSTELAFGETFTYENGLSITVSAPEPFTPSDVSAGGEDFPAHVRFNVTIVNGTSERYEPGAFSTSLQSANQEGDAVFDNGLEGAPTTVLLPGREASFPIGYGVTNPDDLVLEVSPGFEYESIVYFTG